MQSRNAVRCHQHPVRNSALSHNQLGLSALTAYCVVPTPEWSRTAQTLKRTPVAPSVVLGRRPGVPRVSQCSDCHA